MGSLKRLLNCNIITSLIKFFYSNAIGMIPLIDGLEYTINMVWSKLIQRLDFAMSTMSLFLLSNANKFITHTLICLEKIVLGLIDYL